MRSAVGELIASARAAKRPKWSQQFLADELTLRGFPATRSHIARLESSRRAGHREDMLCASAIVLEIPHELVEQAILADYRSVCERIQQELSQA